MESRTDSHLIAADPHDVLAMVGRPHRLAEWHGAFARAPEGRTRPLDAGTELRAEVPGGRLRLTWTVAPEANGTRLVQRAVVEGTARTLLGRTVRAVTRDFADHAARLARLLEPAPASASRVVISGGTGFLGRRLAADLQTRGQDVVLLTRRVKPWLPYRQVEWDGRNPGEWIAALRGPEVNMVNLAGRLVDVRPTRANIASLRDSRVAATRVLVEASRHPDITFGRWLQASSTAIWADTGEAPVDESTPLPVGEAALPQMTGVALPWEEEARRAEADRLHLLRISVVFERDSPVFDRLTGLARHGLGGTVGPGSQWVSWIHLVDWLRIARLGLGIADTGEPSATAPLPEGVLAVTAPHAVRNRELMSRLRQRFAPSLPGLRPGGVGMPTPQPLLRLGAVALQTDPALALTGRRVRSRMLGEIGYRFRFPRLGQALDDIAG